MPQNKPALPANAAALVLALDADTTGYPAGCNAHLFPDGVFRADDGRPASVTGGEIRDWRMDAAIAAALIARFNASGKPILYDYEHRSCYGDSRAAGWIDRLTYVPGQGLYAHVDWTPKASEAIAKKEYRYSSPYFYFDPANGAIKQLISVALTNNPALSDLGAVGLKRDTPLSPTAQEAEMADEKQVAALTAERDGLKTNMAALTAERDTLKTEVAALTAERDSFKAKMDAAEAEKAAAALAAEQKTKDDLLTAACGGDKPLITPAEREAMKDLPLSALTRILDAKKPVPLTRQADGKDTHAVLTAEELAMCSRMGVSADDFVKAKAARA
ncbi:MAG: phage protease [Azonexus sp.]|jgi:phage I-like protein|nr:phage protease [Azonexus sp.]